MTMAMAAQSRFRAAWLAAAACASVFTALLAGCAAPAKEQQDTISQMVTASEESDVRKRARIRLELASGYYAEGKTEIALDELKQVIATDPSFGDAYNLRGLIYMRLGDNREAEQSFKRAVALNP